MLTIQRKTIETANYRVLFEPIKTKKAAKYTKGTCRHCLASTHHHAVDPFSHFTLSTSPSPLVATILISVSMYIFLFIYFYILHTDEIIQYFWHTSDTYHFAYYVQGPLCCHKWQDFIFFYGWYIWYIYHIFIHSFINGHCFHILATINNAVINTGMYVFLN